MRDREICLFLVLNCGLPNIKTVFSSLRSGALHVVALYTYLLHRVGLLIFEVVSGSFICSMEWKEEGLLRKRIVGKWKKVSMAVGRELLTGTGFII